MRPRDERYRGYLLRLWRMEPDGAWVWCAALEEVHTGERRTFSTLQALIAFLLAICPEQPPHQATNRPR